MPFNLFLNAPIIFNESSYDSNVKLILNVLIWFNLSISLIKFKILPFKIVVVQSSWEIIGNSPYSSFNIYMNSFYIYHIVHKPLKDNN